MRGKSFLSASRGFTLVELLVAMVLLGLISALLFGGLRYTARTAAYGTAVLDRASDVALAATFLRSALADATPLPDPDNGVIAFAGGAERIVLAGAAPPHLARGGFYRIEIALDRDTHMLAAHWTPLLSDDASQTEDSPPASPLLEHVARAEFGYFGALGDTDAPSWNAEWGGQAGLPRLIRLRIGFIDGTEAPDLIVAIRTAVGALP